jgi:hypothetical protein
VPSAAKKKELNMSTERQIKKDIDIVCPICFKSVEPSQSEGDFLADGVRRRSYSAWCPQCSLSGQGYIVIQFYHGGRWRIEKFIPVKPLFIFSGDWQHIQDPIPQQAEAQAAPVLQFGPGGDFSDATTDEQLTSAIETCKSLLTQLADCGRLINDILHNRKTKIQK